MEAILDIGIIALVLVAAFVIAWGAEAAQTFMPRALALSLLAWLQTLPEFAVEADIAWNQQRDLMIANLTGSLRLLVGLGWPMVFFVYFFSTRDARGRRPRALHLDSSDFLSVVFLFLSILYFAFIWWKGRLAPIDSIFLIALYLVYLYLGTRLGVVPPESEDSLPWVSRKIARLPAGPRLWAVLALFAAGGITLYLCVHPFVGILQKWSLSFGLSTFVFVQWVAPFMSEFPEKLSAFNWARQPGKAPLAILNLISSNINQWTVLAAMIPLVFSLSLGYFAPVIFDSLHQTELALTLAQSALGVLVLLDLRLSLYEALAIFILWAVQFFFSSLRGPVLEAYAVWIAVQIAKTLYVSFRERRAPRALRAMFVLAGGRVA